MQEGTEANTKDVSGKTQELREAMEIHLLPLLQECAPGLQCFEGSTWVLDRAAR